MQGEKPTVLEAHEVEPAPPEGGDRSGLEVAYRACDDQALRPIGDAEAARPGERDDDPHRFGDRRRAQTIPEPRKKTAATRVYVSHGHTRFIPSPRNHAPVAVSAENAKKSRTNRACTASLLDAEYRRLIR